MTKTSKMPFIKWTGSKRKQAPYIVSQFPKAIDTYYEPFVGGGSVMHELLNEIALGNIKCNKIICSDVNTDLIDVWNLFKNKDTRYKLYDFYCNLHQKLKDRAEYKEGDEVTREQVQKCQTLYYEQRDIYNSLDRKHELKPYIFYWLSRTSFNGLIRYNPKTGNFNAPFHVGGRFGISPEQLISVFESWGSVMDLVDIEFVNKSYDEVICNTKEGDVVYMDPPYANTTGMYFCNGFDEDKFWNILREMTNKNVKWLLSYDGKTGDEDRTANVPKDLFVRHEYVNAGHSSFKKLKSKSVEALKDKNKDVVKDSLYMNYD